MQQDRQRGQQHRKQGQGVVCEEHPATPGQPAIVERIGDGDQRRGGQRPCEQRLTAVPGGGDEKERQDEEQAFLVDQLGRVAQQRRRDLPAEAAGEGLPQEVLEDQPDPADQHDDCQYLGEALLPVDHDETEHARTEAEQGDGAWIAGHQAADQGDQLLQAGLEDGALLVGHGEQRVLDRICSASRPGRAA